MNRTFFAAACMASVVAAAPALSQELGADERTELRERADRLVAERQRNPAWDGGTTRLTQTRSDVRLDQDRGEVKTPKRGDVKTPQRGEVDTKVKGGKKPRREAIKKRMKRAVEDVPGAFVRGR